MGKIARTTTRAREPGTSMASAHDEFAAARGIFWCSLAALVLWALVVAVAWMQGRATITL